MPNSLTNLLGASEIDRRRYPREDVDDGSVEIHGQIFPVKNWSARGFMAKPCDVDCNIADELDVKIVIRFASEVIEFNCQAIVARIDKKRLELGAAFVKLDDADQIAVASHFNDHSTSIHNLFAVRP